MIPSFSVLNASLIQGSNEPREFFVGEVTSYTLHNLSPSTTYDVNVYAQYDSGMSIPLTDQGTTCKSEQFCCSHARYICWYEIMLIKRRF